MLDQIKNSAFFLKIMSNIKILFMNFWDRTTSTSCWLKALRKCTTDFSNCVFFLAIDTKNKTHLTKRPQFLYRKSLPLDSLMTQLVAAGSKFCLKIRKSSPNWPQAIICCRKNVEVLPSIVQSSSRHQAHLQFTFMTGFETKSTK